MLMLQDIVTLLCVMRLMKHSDFSQADLRLTTVHAPAALLMILDIAFSPRCSTTCGPSTPFICQELAGTVSQMPRPSSPRRQGTTQKVLGKGGDARGRGLGAVCYEVVKTRMAQVWGIRERYIV